MPSQLGLLLMDRGVQIQGYLVSRPLKAATVPMFLDRGAAASRTADAHDADARRSDLDASATRLRTLRMPATAPAASDAAPRRPKRVSRRPAEPDARSAEFLHATSA